MLAQRASSRPRDGGSAGGARTREDIRLPQQSEDRRKGGLTTDLYGNLLRVDLPDGRAIEYEVDGAGRRVGRRELDADGFEISFRGWIYRDLLRPIAEVDSQGNVVARYIYSDGDGARQNGVHQLSTRLGANQDTSVSFSGNNVPELIELLDGSGGVARTLALMTNQVGSVQLVADAETGDVLQRLEYDSFGRMVFDSAPGTQPFGFAGGLYDPESRLTRFGARDYSGDVGRWNARDPVRFAGGTPNQFEYAWNDPVNSKDVLGTITQREHCDRNKLNRCPYNEPSQKECGENNEQDFEYTGGLGGGKYRSPDGSECAYDENGHLLPDDGSYSYNYASDPYTWEHIRDDVIPDLEWGKCYAGQTTVY